MGLDSPVTLIWDYILDGYIVPMYNEEILEEYSGVLKRSKFNLTEDQVNIIVEAYFHNSSFLSEP